MYTSNFTFSLSLLGTITRTRNGLRQESLSRHLLPGRTCPSYQIERSSYSSEFPFFTEYFGLWELYEHVCCSKSQMAYTDVEYKSRLNGRTEYHASADPTRGSAVVRCLIRCRSVSRWGTAKSFLVETRSCVRCGGAPSSPSLARIYPLWGFSPYWARAAWGTLVDLMSLLSIGINNTYRDRSWGGDYGVLYIDCHPLIQDYMYSPFGMAMKIDW